ncbi:SRPBCC family protein [Nocardioides lianchengensis]|uniref:Polyketide cyclase / dehydrase and lipid transport n=1 Tax=Nocardioides lianchengensis TaxID=1045774 RepID=A0A1G6QW57_9ACTN|nr:SRPBCC family protein [Nocardioides lianchengensis]NYG10466.1 carbon monoxide dehydrogenase subunit G [Nocardioides lianchengensis]SDC96501.1 Polyketide cyclase / dehydrase and lipid transport [Nocardioides lianchengensis]
MRTDVAVTQERLIPTRPAAVWSVVADPAMQERLDGRVRLESSSGADGEVGSGYVLAIRVAPLVKMRLTYDVVEADPESRLVAHVTRKGVRYGEQHAELTSGPDGTLLRWTVVVSVGPVTARIAEQSVAQQLTPWLDAVAREAQAVGPA